jgi:hypothetical protein
LEEPALRAALLEQTDELTQRVAEALARGTEFERVLAIVQRGLG